MYKQKQRQQTEEALQEALLVLMREHVLEDISVTQLVKEAGVSRMTFYRIYDSLPDLFHALLDQVFYQLLEHATPFIVSGNWQAFWSALFEFLYARQDTVKLLLGSKDYTTILNYMNDAFIDEEAEEVEQYYLAAMIGMAFNLMRTWAHHDFHLEPASMAQLATSFSSSAMNNLANPAIIESYLRKKHL